MPRKFTPLLPLALAPALLGSVHAAGFTVGLAFDVGGRGDRGFNQGAYEGARRALRETGGGVQTSEPRTVEQVGRGIGRLAGQGADLVIGVGFSNNAAISAAAAQHPGTRFVTVDDLPQGPNTVGLRFREQEGSFLAGYLAGLQSATGRVGFIGGLDVPVIRRFQAGFGAGVKFACPACQVRNVYVGTTSQGFNNPAAARRLAADMMRGGTDIIYAAAGASGQGVIDQVKAQPCLKAANLPAGVRFRANPYAALPRSAAEAKTCAGNTRPTFFIGVDTNQNRLGDFDGDPRTLNHGLTSMLKRVDNAVYAVVKDVAESRPWRAGDRSFGLSNGGVALAMDSYNQALVSPALQARLKGVQGLVVNGVIKVPTR